MNTSNLTAALSYAARGWRILPCDPAPGERAKAPLGRLVPRGCHDATSDPARVTDWWTNRPDALIGGVVPTGMFVIDTDPRNGGNIKNLEDAYGALPPTPTVLSGRGDGGCHLYFRRFGDAPLSAAGLKRAGHVGIDVKTSTGYCILPPSLHPDTGLPYEWAGARQPADPPSWLRSLLLTPRGTVPARTVAYGGPASRWDGLLREVTNAPDGEQNWRIFWAAKRAAAEGAPEQWFDELEQTAAAANHPPARIRRAIDSGRRAVTGAAR